MQNPPIPQKPQTVDDNASARMFALALSEEELYRESRGRYVPMFPYPPDRPIVFIKYGREEKQAEGNMQRLAFDWLNTERQRTHCNIYTPEVYKIFTIHKVTFIVMQFIEARHIHSISRQLNDQQWNDLKSAYYDLIADGIQILRRMPVPDGQRPGPRTSGRRRIKHMIFKDQKASVEYNTIQELQDHLNRVARLAFRSNPDPPQIDLEKELVFCYTDHNDENFMFTTDADDRLRLYIIDFEHASFLPVSLLAYVVFTPSRWPVCDAIRERIASSLPQVNMEVMDRICYLFQISVWTVGLTEEQRRR